MEIYWTRIKYLLRNKGNIFWAFFFPLILGTFFYFSFGKFMTNSSFRPINIYIANDLTDNVLIEVLKSADYDDKNKLFDVNTSYTKDELENYFNNEKINTYIYSNNEQIIYQIRNNGIEETITKYVLDEYIQVNTFYKYVFQNEPEKITEIQNSLNNRISYLVEKVSDTNPNANALVMYFYALIAMACTFAGYWGIGLVKDIQADQSPLASRVNITPTHKLKLILIYALAAITVHFIGNLGLIAYLKFVLNIEFTNHIILIILTSLVGTISGISLGAFLSSFIKASPSTKEGLITTISLFLSFLSGLMIIEVKYLVSKYIPILSYINPASLLTDCFYSLYYYNDIGKYFFNLGLLSLVSIILIFFTYLKLRGKSYDSI